MTKSREDYFQFGGTVKAYFCNNPIKIKKWESGAPVKRSSSNRSDRLNKSKNNDSKRFPNDERFYLPKSQSNQTEVAVTRGKQTEGFSNISNSKLFYRSQRSSVHCKFGKFE